MQIELISKQVINGDGNKSTNWFIVRGNDEIVININKVLGQSIVECNWINDYKRNLEISYHDYDRNEFIAIMDEHGVVIRDGISSIEKNITEHSLFIIQIDGIGLGEEAVEYGLASDDKRYAVINWRGKFVIPPKYDFLDFDTEANLFFGTTREWEDVKFSPDGEIVK